MLIDFKAPFEANADIEEYIREYALMKIGRL